MEPTPPSNSPPDFQPKLPPHPLPVARPPAPGVPPAVRSSGALTRKPVDPGPLTPEHFTDIRRAVKLRQPVQKAAGVANLSAGSTLAIAVISVVFALIFWDPAVVLLSLAAVGSGVVEHLGYRRLRRADESAIRLLVINQLVLFGIITLYCIISMLRVGHTDALSGLSPADRQALQGTPGVSDMMQSYSSMLPYLMYGFYTVIIVSSLLCQGGMAAYYYTRGIALEKYQQLTPNWIKQLLDEVS